MTKLQKNIIFKSLGVCAICALAMGCALNKTVLGATVLCTCFCIVSYVAYAFIMAIKHLIEDYKLAGFLTEEEFEIYRSLDESFHVFSSSLSNRIHSVKDIRAAEKTEK